MAIRIGDIKSAGTSYAELDDKMLVLDFQAGQPAAFVEIHRRYAPLAKHVCRRFLPNSQDADEAFQETMIRVFQGLFRFNGQYALQPWIARIATNVSLDQIRSKARRPQVDDDSLEEHDREDTADTPDQLVERLLERDLVLSVLADLPESHRRALVLREIEGRSHKEIAESMAITPAQAKALIHRAKGSFRRSWLVKVTERGGAMALAVLPLVWAMRAMGAAKRVGDRFGHLGQVAQATTPEIVTTTASVATPAATGIAERAVAAGVTLLIAGGVTVGAVTATRHRAPDPEPHRALAAPVVDERNTERNTEAAAPVTPSPDEPRERPDRGRHEAPAVPVETPSPTVEPSPSVAPTPSPTEQPSPQPSPTESPTMAPVPDRQFSFITSATTTERCGCSGWRVVSSSVEGEMPNVSFSESIEGVALDGAGGAAWTLSLDLTGQVTETSGDLSINFVLGAGGVLSPYVGTASLAAAETAGSGPSVFRFSGSYAAQGDVAEGRPISGSFTAVVGIWPDNTIYMLTVALS